ncbi:hypothetical protein BDV27DRAFT_127576 [Aspergillus caelatus]|uniref:Uncharacterized protein n=1 Tax=Aspergillus caelatus TaxID=61420 RepID=A0A5N7A7C9_9EURO|nr:uncharacterized protein BDV27DRAFT_127576 [Aspergillus caelatus]KAE8365029.1 hypothetical protein BDV27DRAFT_127576 [Aspergillus caelatus]
MCFSQCLCCKKHSADQQRSLTTLVGMLLLVMIWHYVGPVSDYPPHLNMLLAVISISLPLGQSHSLWIHR